MAVVLMLFIRERNKALQLPYQGDKTWGRSGLRGRALWNRKETGQV
jgi:hypothetical protein